MSFSVSHFQDLCHAKTGSDALLRMYLSLMEKHFFDLRKTGLGVVKKSIREGLLKVFKHNLSEINQNLQSRDHVILTSLNISMREVMSKRLFEISKEAHKVKSLSENKPMHRDQDITHEDNYFDQDSLLRLKVSKNLVQMLRPYSDKECYLVLKDIGITEMSASQLSTILLISNQLERISFWGDSLLRKFWLLNEHICNQGIEGRLTGGSLNLRPFSDKIPQFVFSYANLLERNRSTQEEDLRKLLPARQTDLFSEHLNLIGDVDLSAEEKQYVNIFCHDPACKDINLVRIFSDDMSDKLNSRSCQQILNNLMGLLKSSEEFFTASLSEFDFNCLFSDFQEKTLLRLASNYILTSRPVFKTISHSIVFLLNCFAKTSEISSHRESLLNLLTPQLVLHLSIISKFCFLLMKLGQSYSQCKFEISILVFYYFYILKLLLPSGLQQGSSSVEDLLCLNEPQQKSFGVISLFIKGQLYLKHKVTMKAMVVLLFDWLVSLYPKALTVSDLNHISYKLKSPLSDPDEFLLTGHFFIKLLHRVQVSQRVITTKKESLSRGPIKPKTFGKFNTLGKSKAESIHKSQSLKWTQDSLKQMILKSDLLKNISETQRFIEDPKFLAANFYDDRKRNPNQSYFKLILILLKRYFFVMKNENGHFSFAYTFLERHFKRVQMILRLSSIGEDQSTDNKVFKYSQYSLLSGSKVRSF